MKIAIVADSTICPTKEQTEKYHFEIVPVNVRFEGKVYRDWIDLSAEQAYGFLEKNPDDWSTSAPSPGDFLNAFKKIKESGIKEILCLTAPKELSATWNSARMAKEAAKTELPYVKIELIDAQTLGAGETLLIINAHQLMEEQKSLEEVAAFIEDLKPKIKLYFLLETIKHIHRSGRIPEIASKIGALLPLKPILKISDGKLRPAAACRNKEKGLEKLLAFWKAEADQNYLDIGIMHADCVKDAEILKEKILNIFPSAKIFISQVSPVMGYAFGRGAILISYRGK